MFPVLKCGQSIFQKESSAALVPGAQDTGRTRAAAGSSRRRRDFPL